MPYFHLWIGVTLHATHVYVHTEFRFGSRERGMRGKGERGSREELKE